MMDWSYGSSATTGRRSSARRAFCVGGAALLVLAGCDAHDHEHAHDDGTSHGHAHTSGHHTHTHSGDGHHDPSTWGELPEWALRTAQLHGGLGPWAISGAIAGRDARERLAPASDEVLQVVYKLPIGVDEAPNMCVADGLQVGAGVSFGKKTIEVRHTDTVPLLRSDGVSCASGVSVFVVRNSAGTPLRAFEYRPNDELRLLLEEGTLGSLADDARAIIPRPAGELFTITPVEGEALARLLMPGDGSS